MISPVSFGHGLPRFASDKNHGNSPLMFSGAHDSYVGRRRTAGALGIVAAVAAALAFLAGNAGSKPACDQPTTVSAASDCGVAEGAAGAYGLVAAGTGLAAGASAVGARNARRREEGEEAAAQQTDDDGTDRV